MGRIASPSLVVLLGLLLVTSNAFPAMNAIPPSDVNSAVNHYFVAPLLPQYARPLNGANDNNNGGFLGVLKGNDLHYKIAHSITAVSKIGIYGPRRATTDPNNLGVVINDQADSRVVGMDAPLVKELDPYPRSLSGVWTLTSAEMQMLFSQALFVRIDSEGFPNGALAGAILRDSYVINLPSYLIDMVGNDGYQFPIPTDTSSNFPSSAGTTSVGVGYLYISLTGAQNRWNGFIFHSMETPGRLLVRCKNGLSATLVANGASPFVLNNVEVDEAVSMEMHVTGQCYLFATSAAYPDGELFAYPFKSSHFDVQLNGANMGVASGYVASAHIWADRASRWLYGNYFSNLTTADITDISVHNQDTDALICRMFPGGLPATRTLPTVGCRVNETDMDAIWNARTYVVVSTTANPGGELRGLARVTEQPETSSGLGAGAIAGIVIGVIAGVALIGGVIYFGVTKGWFSKVGGNSRV